jgi:hypothetical protein
MHTRWEPALQIKANGQAGSPKKDNGTQFEFLQRAQEPVPRRTRRRCERRRTRVRRSQYPQLICQRFPPMGGEAPTPVCPLATP